MLSASKGDKIVATSADCSNACCAASKSRLRSLTLAGPAAPQAKRGRGLLVRAVTQPCDSNLQGRRAPSGTSGAVRDSNIMTEMRTPRYRA